MFFQIFYENEIIRHWEIYKYKLHFSTFQIVFFSGHLQMTCLARHYYEKKLLLPSMVVSDAQNLYRDANMMQF
jgi:hypothetical protein